MRRLPFQTLFTGHSALEPAGKLCPIFVARSLTLTVLSSGHENHTAAKFKEQCLALLDRVDPDGILITKHGKPVAKLVPVHTDNAN